MEEYRYPDVGDRITMELIRKTQPYPGYWEASEERILERIGKAIRPGARRLLDAGCGQGRLSMRFARHCSEIVAIDPDGERLAEARRATGEENVTFIQVDTTGYEMRYAEGQRFDAILCSHIIQHVDTGTLVTMLRSFANLLKLDGSLFLTTTHAVQAEDCFTVSRWDEGEVSDIVVSRERFEREKGLRVRFFTRDSLESLLKEVGFEIVDWQVYHHGKTSLIDRFLGIDTGINLTSSRQRKSGRDQYLACRLTDRGSIDG